MWSLSLTVTFCHFSAFGTLQSAFACAMCSQREWKLTGRWFLGAHVHYTDDNASFRIMWGITDCIFCNCRKRNSVEPSNNKLIQKKITYYLEFFFLGDDLIGVATPYNHGIAAVSGLSLFSAPLFSYGDHIVHFYYIFLKHTLLLFPFIGRCCPTIKPSTAEEL